MKKLFALLFVTGLLVGCSEDFLETTPQATLFAVNYFQTEEELDEALVAVYDALGHQKGQGLDWSPYLVLAEALSDDAFAGGQDPGDAANLNELNTFDISTTNGVVHSAWKRNFYGIGRANFVIERTSNTDGLSAEFVATRVAQAKFLRAYFYFELVKFFENVPLLTSTVTPSEGNMPQATPDVVYNQITADLVDAIAVLPEEYTEERGRATTWSAKALLGRVYLFYKGVYGGTLDAGGTTINDAYVLSELEDIINNSYHDLEPDYTTLFTAAGEFSDENVFEVVYNDSPIGGDWGAEERVEGNLAAQMMGPRASGSTIYYRGWAFAVPSHKLYQSLFGDPRLASTLLTEADILAEAGTELNTTAYQHTGYYSAKYTTRLEDRGTQGTPELHNMVNYRAIRYADVLLMAAELGQNVAYINQVRNRVGLAPIATYSESALFDERRKELAGEGHRYFDLLRRGLAVAQSELDDSGPRGPQYTGDDEVYQVSFNQSTRGFLPIPQLEIDLSNDVLIQNDGY